MSARIKLARALLTLGEFIKTLPLVVMRPDDLIEFSRQSYARSNKVAGWADTEFVDSGLTADETALAAALPETTGDLLLLGVGGGREAIPLAQMGFRVTGLDYVAAMVDSAVENAAAQGIHIDGLVQEISRLNVAPGAYDVVWLSRAMYSCVPTRARRVATVRRIATALRHGGYFLCQFHWDPRAKASRRARFARRLVAACTLGNTAYEEGDLLWHDIEFIHAFTSEDVVRAEFEEGGLSVVRIVTDQGTLRGNAICRNAGDADGKA
jgi:SAM-dependent methyltransferase